MNPTRPFALLVGFAVICVAAGSAFWMAEVAGSAPYFPVATGTPAPAPAPAPAPSGYTMTQVLSHATAASCWSAVNGSVYDLTSWVGSHPGGREAIVKLCGRDGSRAFNEQHGGQQQQADVLATFRIGALVQ